MISTQHVEPEDDEFWNEFECKARELYVRFDRSARDDAMWDDANILRRALTSTNRHRGNLPNNPSPASNGNPGPSRTNSPSSFNTTSLMPSISAAASTPSLSATMNTNEQAHQNNHAQKKVPIFFREDYAGFIVKGNFNTLANKPQLVEDGEWMAHQRKLLLHVLYSGRPSNQRCRGVLTNISVVEQNRLVSGMLKCVQEKDRTLGRPVCNESVCPTMAAGA